MCVCVASVFHSASLKLYVSVCSFLSVFFLRVALCISVSLCFTLYVPSFPCVPRASVVYPAISELVRTCVFPSAATGGSKPPEGDVLVSDLPSCEVWLSPCKTKQVR